MATGLRKICEALRILRRIGCDQPPGEPSHGINVLCRLCGCSPHLFRRRKFRRASKADTLFCVFPADPQRNAEITQSCRFEVVIFQQNIGRRDVAMHISKCMHGAQSFQYTAKDYGRLRDFNRSRR